MSKKLNIVFKIIFLSFFILISLSSIINLYEKKNDIKFKTITNNEFIIKGNMINKIDILIKKIEKEND